MTSFAKWVKNFFFLLIYLLSGGVLALVIDGVSTGTELSPLNVATENTIAHIRTPLLTQLFLFITNVGSPFILSCLAVLLAIYLLLRKDTYDALLYLSSMTLAIVAFTILKSEYRITRPASALVDLASWSFPSGHAAVSTAFFFATAYTFWDKIRLWPLRIVFALLCASAAALICFSRLYLSVHYALDVLAGVTLGICAVSMVILIFNIFIEEEKWRRKKRSARI